MTTPTRQWKRGDRVWLDGWLPAGVKAAAVVCADEALRLYSPGFVGVEVERELLQVPTDRLEPRGELVPGDLYLIPGAGRRSPPVRIVELRGRSVRIEGRNLIRLDCGRAPHPQPDCPCATCGFARAWGIEVTP